MELVGNPPARRFNVVAGAPRSSDAPPATLPLDTKAQCTSCSRVLPATLLAADGGVVLERRCPEHGAIREELNDVLFSRAEPDRAGQPTHTRSGARIRPVVRALPKTVETLCPECARVVIGRVFVWQGDVYMEKACPAHGYVKDRVFTNAALYLKLQQWSFRDGAGLENPQVEGAESCPGSCGLCNQHQSHTMLGQIDLTNRCNLACPVCFANASVQGFVVEPSFEQIVKLLEALRSYRPTPASAVQLTGGEPTIRDDYLDIVRRAKALGFSHVQTASNGIRFAEPGFARRAAEAGLHTVYLQFDGVDDRVYEATRGRALLATKVKAVEAIHEAGMKICLVPTIVRGVNDDQVEKIFRFAVEHIHVVSAIAYQPVAFTGRIETAEREAQRYTMGDLANGLAATGLVDPMRDFYPLSLVAPISRLLAALSGEPKITATSHPSCSSGTYFLVSRSGEAVPITRVFDIEGLFRDVDAAATRIEGSRFKWLHKAALPFLFRRHFRREHAPEGLTVRTFLHALRGMTDKRVGRGKAGERTYRTLLAAGMHFQDRYNYDVERVKRCVIHYSTPEGLFPFCAYNSGPIHRQWIERKHAIPLQAWRARARA
ncbi:MAG TPA: radical SAM protein [Anaeromyxobacter sp.]|nr:radical SAM protein [Anaeromyxobacter sp.]